VLLVTAVSLLFVPVILLIRLISPIVKVRFGFLSSSFGHMVLGCELYLARKAHNLEPRRTIDLFLADTRHSNAFVVEMLRRRVTIVWRPLIRALMRANELVPGKSRHLVNLDEFMDPDDLLARTPPQLIFTTGEARQADEALRSLGLEPGQPFVCLHVRDAAFKLSTNPRYDPLTGDFRNADIRDYLDAARSLVSRGYTVIRMGAIVDSELPSGLEGVVDYARSGMRSDFTDTVLAARCSFWMGTPSGAHIVAIVTGRPVVFTDVIPLGIQSFWRPGDLYIPKKLRNSEGRLLTIWDILRGGIGWPEMRNGVWSHSLAMYEERGFTIVDNSPAEICAVAEEMDDRLRGKTSDRDEREDRIQVEIASLLEASRWHGKVRARVGSDFIKSNPDLVAPF
jgi:putative glycosyltransferase (TIGR04372 family)